jgi:hypothetical protein
MRKLVTLLLFAFVSVLPAAAQTKIEGQITCAKAEINYSADVGDTAGHALLLQKASCQWSKPLRIAGLSTGASTDTSTLDARGSSMQQRGYNVSTMSNGDKFAVRYQGVVRAKQDGSAAYSGTWTFASGTGKLRGIRGGGTYRGIGAADGSGVIDVVGQYTLPSAKAAPKPSM